jgi:predicted nucleic acid-binding protein
MSVLLDSDIVIEILRSRDQEILALWNALANSGSEILFSPVTGAEVWAGARPSELQTITGFFPMLTCAQADYRIGKLAGDLIRQFGKSHGLKIGDALIAATAIQHQAALWTRNRKHYPMPGLNFHS